MVQARALAENTLQEIVRRIVEVADPVKIILFGSAARDEMGPNSDADFLVVIEPGKDRRELAAQCHTNLWGVCQAIDIVVVTTEDVERYKDSPALVIHPALRDGRTVYERARATRR